MAKYRKRPVVIDAEQWFAHHRLRSGVGTQPNDTGVDDLGVYYMRGYHYVNTPEGCMHVRDGDWIITSIENERSVCKDSVFKATCEPWRGGN